MMPTSTTQRVLSAFLAASLFAALSVHALEVPAPPSQWVTDRAGVLGSEQVTSLNEKLRAFEQRSGAQFIIYVLPSLEGDPLEDFTIRAADKWKVGQAKYDNGVILFVFPQDRKLRFEVGYGLEGSLTDAFTSTVIREAITPHFRNNDYATGLNAGADQIIARVENKEAPVPVSAARPSGDGSLTSLLPVIFILLIFIFVIGPMLRRGGGCLGCILPFPMGGGGITFGGGGGGWSSGGGGSWGGGGGFSGGGGGFGGGGSSGSW